MKITFWKTSIRSFGAGFTRVPESHPAAVRANVHVMWMGTFAFIALAIFSGVTFAQGRRGDAALIGFVALVWAYIAVMAKIRVAKTKRIDPLPGTRL